jgi:hypothetical protein
VSRVTSFDAVWAACSVCGFATGSPRQCFLQSAPDKVGIDPGITGNSYLAPTFTILSLAEKLSARLRVRRTKEKSQAGLLGATWDLLFN